MKKYLITDPVHYGRDKGILSQKLISIYRKNKPDFTCFRDKDNNINFKEVAKAFVGISRGFDIEKVLINTDIEVAADLGADGVHLNSSQFSKIKYAKDIGLFTIISAHSLDEALFAEKEGADAVTFSPVFDTPNKGEPQGLEKLKEIVDTINIQCFALGGIILEEQIKLCKKTGAYGFASIRYFTK